MQFEFGHTQAVILHDAFRLEVAPQRVWLRHLYSLSRWLCRMQHQALMEGDSIGIAAGGHTVKEKAAPVSLHSEPRDWKAARQRERRRVRIVTGVVFLLLVAAWFLGYFQSDGDVLTRVSRVLPTADRIEPRGSMYYGYASVDGVEELVGYAGVSDAVGYSGPIRMLVGVDQVGTILGVEVIEHRETPGFFELLNEKDFLWQFLGMDYADPLRLDEDLDAVSGATISSEAVARAIREQTRELGSGPIGARVPPSREPIQFGVPEIVLIGLFVAWYFGHRARNAQAKKWTRRATLLVGVIAIGFVFNKPLTLANFISLFSGYWPDWHTNLYWFLLLGGILFVTTAQAKNPYCSWFCPFGAVQEGLGRVGGAKLYRPRKWHVRLQWFQRALVFCAIAIGLALRQPGAVSYEPFGTLFDFTGGTALWILLGLVLLASFVVYRPFCSYICPLTPVVDYIGEGRRWGESVVKKARK